MQRDFHYPLAFTTLACPDWSWEQVVQKAVEYGYQGLELLGLPVKLRQAPAAYHSTEQSEMDGPPFLVSLRVLARDHEKSILGTYTDTFLCAQAVSTWQAMLEQGRLCFLLILDGPLDDAVETLRHFLSDVAAHLRG